MERRSSFSKIIDIKCRDGVRSIQFNYVVNIIRELPWHLCRGEKNKTEYWVLTQVILLSLTLEAVSKLKNCHAESACRQGRFISASNFIIKFDF